MNSMKLVIPLHPLYWSIHTKYESKRATAFAFIFGVNWLWCRGVTASFGVFFYKIKCNGMTSFMEFMPLVAWVLWCQAMVLKCLSKCFTDRKCVKVALSLCQTVSEYVRLCHGGIIVMLYCHCGSHDPVKILIGALISSDFRYVTSPKHQNSRLFVWLVNQTSC